MFVFFLLKIYGGEKTEWRSKDGMEEKRYESVLAHYDHKHCMVFSYTKK